MGRPSEKVFRFLINAKRDVRSEEMRTWGSLAVTHLIPTALLPVLGLLFVDISHIKWKNQANEEMKSVQRRNYGNRKIN